MVYIYLFLVWVGVQGDSQRFLFYVFEQVEGLCLFWWVLFDLLLDLGLVYKLILAYYVTNDFLFTISNDRSMSTRISPTTSS